MSLGGTLLVRLLFATHGFITVWRVTEVKSDPLYYLLIIPVCLLPLEMILTLKLTEYWKWLCLSVILYLGSVVPGIWLLNFESYQKRIEYIDSMGWEECSMDTSYNTSSLSAEIAGVTLTLALSDDSWIMALEQVFLALLLLGRWLLPTELPARDQDDQGNQGGQLSQVLALLVYIGMAADILEFSFASLNEQAVICNLALIIVILGIWSWSLLQFTLVFTSVSAPPHFGNKMWITMIIMQDVPCLAMRLFLLIEFKIINQVMLFFILKNILVTLQLYRIVSCDNRVFPQNANP